MAKSAPGMRYRRQIPETLRESYLAATTDPEVLDLRDEVALARSLLTNCLDKWAPQLDAANPLAVDQLLKVIREVRDSVTALAVLEGKLNTQIDVRQFPMIVNFVVETIRCEVNDERLVSRISKRLGEIPVAGDKLGALPAAKLEAPKALPAR